MIFVIKMIEMIKIFRSLKRTAMKGMQVSLPSALADGRCKLK